MRAIRALPVLGVLLSPAPSRSQNGNGSVSSAGNLPAYVSPFIGLEATGGAVAACPAGRIVVGIAGTRSTLLKAVTPLCASFGKDGSLDVVSALDPSAIGVGAQGFRLQCPGARAVTQVRVSFDRMNPANQYLAGVEIGCSSWAAAQWGGPVQQLSTPEFNLWDVKPAAACRNQRQPVRALQIRAVTAVKALSIVCDEI